MSVRTKMNGGKQINLEHQCMAAGLRLTLKPTWTADSRKQFLGLIQVKNLCKQM